MAISQEMSQADSPYLSCNASRPTQTLSAVTWWQALSLHRAPASHRCLAAPPLLVLLIWEPSLPDCWPHKVVRSAKGRRPVSSTATHKTGGCSRNHARLSFPCHSQSRPSMTVDVCMGWDQQSCRTHIPVHLQSRPSMTVDVCMGAISSHARLTFPCHLQSRPSMTVDVCMGGIQQARVCNRPSPKFGPFFFTVRMTQSSLWPAHFGGFCARGSPSRQLPRPLPLAAVQRSLALLLLKLSPQLGLTLVFLHEPLQIRRLAAVASVSM